MHADVPAGWEHVQGCSRSLRVIILGREFEHLKHGVTFVLRGFSRGMGLGLCW